MQDKVRKRVLFLDLEDTVIDDFTRGLFAEACNIRAVRGRVTSFNPAEVRLFSFAISDEHDVQTFKREFQSWLEGILEVSFSLQDCFTTEMLHELCKKHHCFFENDHECMLFHGKDYGFQRYIEMMGLRDAHVLLIDDTVVTKTVTYPALNLVIEMVNVAELT